MNFCFRRLLRAIMLGMLLVPSFSMHAQSPSGTAQAPEFTPPFEPGDILVYRHVPQSPGEQDTFVISTGLGNWHTWPEKESWFHWGWSGYPYSAGTTRDFRHHFSIDTSGFVLHVGDRRDSEYQVYPAFIPRTPQITMNGDIWNIQWVSDTVILGTPTKSFLMENSGLVHFITERFGEVGISTWDGDVLLELTSAIIRDTLFNRDTTKRLYMPLCVGNRYVYSEYRSEGNLTNETYTVVTRDSIINGYLYHELTGDGPLIGWFRSDSTGVYQLRKWNDSCLIRGDVSLGSRTGYGMIIDTGYTNPFPNNEHYLFRVVDSYSDQDYGRHRDWLAGFGLQGQYEWGYGRGSHDYEFIWGIICGEEYGVIVSTEDETIVARSVSITSIHPQPLRDNGTVSFSLPQHENIRLSVHDLLGRCVMTLRDTDMPSGTHQAAINTSSLRPGLYFCLLRTSTAQSVKRFVVAP